MAHEPAPRFWELFFEVYEHLPRQGPGSRASTRRALELCADLPARPVILDLGCGSGAQTMDLAALTEGTITAIDQHAPFIASLERAVAEAGLQERVRPRVGDMAAPPAQPGTVDLVWCEGAAYFLGIERALRLWRPLLRPGGYLAFTEAVWLVPDPPPEVRAMWDAEYPEIGDANRVLTLAGRCGYEVQGHFVLPPADWWQDFYVPMEARIAALRTRYAGDAEAVAAFDAMQAEIDLHRRHSDAYGYLFVVLARPVDPAPG